MQADSVVENICRLTADFYGGSKSMIQLVAESGVSACPDVLTASRILAYVTAHPELVEQWLRWSSNKRVSSGWYFRQRSGTYAVGLYPKGETLDIAHRELACAEFVVREVKALMAIPRAK